MSLPVRFQGREYYQRRPMAKRQVALPEKLNAKIQAIAERESRSAAALIRLWLGAMVEAYERDMGRVDLE